MNVMEGAKVRDRVKVKEVVRGAPSWADREVREGMRTWWYTWKDCVGSHCGGCECILRIDYTMILTSML